MASVTQPPAAAPGKGKGKKPKATKLDIEDFVDSNNFKMVDSSWADIMEDEDVIAPANLPSAPKSALGPDIDWAQLPPNGPFRLSVANLQYEVNVEQLREFFTGLNISDLRMNDGESGRPSGTASLTLSTKNEVLSAMELNNKQLNGRSVRIFMPNMGSDRYGDRDGGRRGGGRSGGSYIDNTPMNWRSATRPEAAASSTGRPDKVFPPPTSGPGSGGFGGGRDRDGFGSRGSRYGGGDGDGGYQRAPRNDYGGGRRDYDGGERRNDDFGRRDGGRRDRYGDEGRSGGNWGRGPPRDAEAAEGGGESSGGNWRRDGPRDPPPQASDRGDNFDRRPRDNGRYNRDDRDGGAPPPARDSYGSRGGGGDGYRRAPPRDEEGGYGGRDRDRDFERRGPPPGAEEPYDAPRRGPSERVNSTSDDYEPPRSFAPPPRDRAMSGRSERSNEDRHDPHQPQSLAHKDEEPVRRGPLRSEILTNLLAPEKEEPKPSSYSSIFGGAKPVDTLKREMEIEKKLADEKAEKAEKEAAQREAAAAAGGGPGSAGGISPAGSASGDQPRRERGPRGDRDGGAPRMRNGEPRGDRDNRGPRRDRFDDRNGGGDRDRPRRDGGDRRGGDGRRDGGGPRLGGNGGNRDMPRRRDDLFSEAEPRGPRGGGYGGGDRRPGGDRGGPRYDDRPQQTRMFASGGGGGGGGRGDFEHFRSDRFPSESDDMPQKNYTSSNKYAHLPPEDHTSD